MISAASGRAGPLCGPAVKCSEAAAGEHNGPVRPMAASRFVRHVLVSYRRDSERSSSSSRWLNRSSVPVRWRCPAPGTPLPRSIAALPVCFRTSSSLFSFISTRGRPDRSEVGSQARLPFLQILHVPCAFVELSLGLGEARTDRVEPPDLVGDPLFLQLHASKQQLDAGTRRDICSIAARRPLTSVRSADNTSDCPDGACGLATIEPVTAAATTSKAVRLMECLQCTHRSKRRAAAPGDSVSQISADARWQRRLTLSEGELVVPETEWAANERSE